MHLLKILWRGWMRFGLIVGTIVSSIILTAFYFAVFGPMAVLFRVFAANPLGRRAARSNWFENETPRLTAADFDL